MGFRGMKLFASLFATSAFAASCDDVCDTSELLKSVTNANDGAAYDIGIACKSTKKNKAFWTVYCDKDGDGEYGGDELYSSVITKDCKAKNNAKSIWEINCGDGKELRQCGVALSDAVAIRNSNAKPLPVLADCVKVMNAKKTRWRYTCDRNEDAILTQCVETNWSKGKATYKFACDANDNGKIDEGENVKEVVVTQNSDGECTRKAFDFACGGDSTPDQTTTTEKPDSTTDKPSTSDATTGATTGGTTQGSSTAGPVSDCKILALHGRGGSSSSFRNQPGMRDLMDALSSECVFVFGDTPESGGVWFRDPPGGNKEPTTDPSWGDATINYLNQMVADQGPFYAVLGYSQGSATIPVFLANTDYTFNRVMMYNGYLPTSHQGLMDGINLVEPFDTPAMVFSGEGDEWFGPLAPAQAAKFSNVVEIHSQNAGHHLPTSDDSTFQQTVNFIRAGLNQT